MSISSSTRKAGPFACNGAAVAFPFAFKVFTTADVRVVLTDSNSVESDLALGTNYTVALNADQDANPGGTVTTTATYATGYLITLTSKLQNLQPVTLTNQGGFYPKVINTALDRLTILVQQVVEQVGRAIKTPISSDLSPDQLIADLYAVEANAGNSAAAAANSAANSAASAAAAAAVLDNFDDRYLGQKTADPSLDNDGNPLQVGALYYNTVVGVMRVYTGTGWIDAATGVTSDDVSFLPGGSGVVQSDVQTKLREFVSVKDFGAVGNGTADDTAAFQNALTNGYPVFIPPGTYKITGSLTVPSATQIFGCGKDSVISLAASMSADLFKIESSNVEFRDFWITGNGTQTNTLFVLRTSVGSLEYVRIEKINTSSCHGFIRDENSSGIIVNLHVIECQHKQPTGRGVLLYDAYAFIFFRKFTVDYVGISAASSNVPCINLENNAGAVFEDCDVLGGTIAAMGSRWGFNITNSQAVWLRRCMADTLGGYGFRITGCVGVYLNNCTASLCDQHGFLIGSSTEVIGNGLYAGGRNALSGSASQQGIYVTNSSSVVLTNLVAKQNTGSGVYLDSSSVANLSNARLASNTGRGLTVDTTATACMGTGVTFAANTAGNYSLGGANHHISGCQLYSGALVVSATGPVSA